MNLVSWISSIKATRRRWQAMLMALDAVVIVLATILTYYARFEGVIPPAYGRWLLPMLVTSAVIYTLYAAFFGLYQIVLRYVGVDTLIRAIGATACGAATIRAARRSTSGFWSGALIR